MHNPLEHWTWTSFTQSINKYNRVKNTDLVIRQNQTWQAEWICSLFTVCLQYWALSPSVNHRKLSLPNVTNHGFMAVCAIYTLLYVHHWRVGKNVFTRPQILVILHIGRELMAWSSALMNNIDIQYICMYVVRQCLCTCSTNYNYYLQVHIPASMSKTWINFCCTFS